MPTAWSGPSAPATIRRAASSTCSRKAAPWRSQDTIRPSSSISRDRVNRGASGGSSVSANMFHVLGVSMAVGRGFQAGEDQAGRDNVVVLSQQLWQDYFRRDPGVLGRVVMLGGVPQCIVGAASPGFTFPDATTRFWIPLHLDPRDPTAYWSSEFMPALGRLRPGVTLGQAQHEIAALSIRMLRLFPY